MSPSRPYRQPAARRSAGSTLPSRFRPVPSLQSRTRGENTSSWYSGASEDQQLRFASYFGDLGRRKKAPEPLRGRAEGIYQTNEKVLLVSNIKVDGAPIGAFGEGEFWFHIDFGYSARPYRYTFLHALELPSTGGNTMFSNMYKAYEAVPERLKQKLRGKKALHVHEYKRSEKADISGDISGIPHHYHPVFITFSVRCETNPRPHSEEVTCSLLRVTVSKNGRTRVARPVSLCAAGARRLMSRN